MSAQRAPRLTRRTFVGLGGLLCALPLLMALGPDAPIREARFLIVGDDVLMDLKIPELMPKTDVDAIAALDSGFATIVDYRIALFAGRARRPIRVFTRRTSVYLDPWTKRYVISTRDEGQDWRRKEVGKREDVVAELVRLRVKVAARPELKKGPQSTYFVRVSAMRNPVIDEPDDGSAPKEDVPVFSQWVSLFVTERPVAEVVVELRSTRFFVEEDR